MLSIKNTCSLSSPFLARLRHAASSSSPIEVRTACCSASIRNTFSSSLTSSDSEARLRSPDLTCGGGERAEWDIVDANLRSPSGSPQLHNLNPTGKNIRALIAADFPASKEIQLWLLQDQFQCFFTIYCKICWRKERRPYASREPFSFLHKQSCLTLLLWPVLSIISGSLPAHTQSINPKHRNQLISAAKGHCHRSCPWDNKPPMLYL